MSEQADVWVGGISGTAEKVPVYIVLNTDPEGKLEIYSVHWKSVVAEYAKELEICKYYKQHEYVNYYIEVRESFLEVYKSGLPTEFLKNEQ